MTESTTGPMAYAETATRLRVAVARLSRQLRQQSPGGLTLSQWSALVTVEEFQPLRIGDLAERESVSAPTATRLVAGLEELGLLSRTTDPADRRTAYVALTESGRGKLDWSRTVRTANLAERLSVMQDSDVDRLVELLPLLEKFLLTEKPPPA